MSIELNNVIKIYNASRQNRVTALNGVNLTIKGGDSVAIMGVSGSGKSTLLHVLGTLDKPTEGVYLLDGKDVLALGNEKLSELRNERFGFVLQHYGLLNNDKVRDNVAVPLYLGKKFNTKEINKRVDAVLEELNIAELKKKKVRDLSGGQRQRVAIARAIVNDPDIILADEPTGALDSKTAKDIMDVFVQLNKKGKTVIMVTHDKTMAAFMRRTVYISDGKITDFADGV